jgi:hypothetical protein
VDLVQRDVSSDPNKGNGSIPAPKSSSNFEEVKFD